MQAPAFAARCMKKSPAHTRHSLFASAMVVPRSTAASAGLSPAAPLTAAINQSAGRDAAGFLLRNGTALMFSPNHKTATDAIDAAPQQPDRRRQHDGGNIAVETIEQPAMARNDVAGILDVEPAFHRRFKQIAKLRGDR